MAEQRDVVVVGAGQAGLSVSRLLTERAIAHVVLERDTIAHEWIDRRWDSFTLVTPNWQCRLPGYAYDGAEPHGFMARDEVHRWLRGYAETFPVPVREGVAVTSVRQRAGGGFALETTDGDLHAQQVVVATGGYHTPNVPRVAERLPRAWTQLHSSEYRSPAALPDGEVLVVGTGQSGAQIAEDLHLDGRRVHLAVGGAPRVARRYRGRDCVDWLQDIGHYDIPVQAQPGGVAKRDNTNHYVTGRGGGHDIDLRQFALDGMSLYGRLLDADATSLQFTRTLERSLDAADAVADGIKDLIDRYIDTAGVDAPTEPRYVPVWRPPVEPTHLPVDRISAVVWAVGFRSDYRWLRVPVFDGAGAPCHHRGVTAVPGLFFIGLPWLHTWGSGRFAAVARDAEFLVDQIGVHARVVAVA